MDTQIKIETGLPIPDRAKYPVAQMNVGDSFFVAGKTSATISGALAYYRSDGVRLATRTVDGGVRVWRIA
jgi:hypothetical protein